MPVASLSLGLPEKANIDHENGIVRDVILAEKGKLAEFKGTDGKAKRLMMTPALIASLMALFTADGEASSHWTHDWIESGKDGLLSKVATFRDFKTNNDGHLIADAHLWPTEHKPTILHAAKNNPKGMMISTVFDYDGGENDAIAKRVHAADFVEVGASTTALLAKLAKLSETTTHTQSPMFTDEQKAELSEMISSGIQAALAEANKPEDKTAELAEADAAEKEAGVTDADKKPEDEKKPAALRAALRIARATERKALSALKEYEKNDVAAQAKFTAMLGRSGAFTPATGVQAAKLSRAKFKALPIDERNKFMRDGGKLED
jgi:hypothetical protein